MNRRPAAAPALARVTSGWCAPSRCTWRVLLVALLALPAAAQWQAPEPQPGEPLCGRCKTTGRLTVEVDSRYSVIHDHGEGWEVLYSSEPLEDAGHGLPWEPCARCKTPSLRTLAEGDYAAAVAERQAWLAERREVDQVVKADKPLIHVETTHFVIAWGIPKIKTEDKKSYRAFEAAHLYARRLEQLYLEYKTRFGIQDSNNMVNKHYLYMFEKEKPFRLAGPRYTGLIGTSSVKRSGGVDQKSSLVSWWNKSEHPSEPDLWRHTAHNMIHLWTSVYYDLAWFQPGEFGLMPPWLNDKYGWLDVGLAHWFERRYEGRTITYCIREQDTTQRWKGIDWERNVYKAVVAERTPSFSNLVTKPSQSITPREHQFCWSYVDFLLARDEQGMGKALMLAKTEHATRDLLKQSWGLTMLSFEEAWAAWVLENYAPGK